MKRAMAPTTNTANTATTAMDSMTEIIMLLNMRLSASTSEMYLTATRVIINPTTWRTDPTMGTIPSTASIEPTPPSVLLGRARAFGAQGRVEDINVCGI